jgi:hypothetical protein
MLNDSNPTKAQAIAGAMIQMRKIDIAAQEQAYHSV